MYLRAPAADFPGGHTSHRLGGVLVATDVIFAMIAFVKRPAPQITAVRVDLLTVGEAGGSVSTTAATK